MEECMLWLYDIQGSILTQKRASDQKKMFVKSATVLRFLKKKQQFLDKLTVCQLLKNFSLNKLTQMVIILIYVSENLQFRNLLGTPAKLRFFLTFFSPFKKMSVC